MGSNLELRKKANSVITEPMSHRPRWVVRDLSWISWFLLWCIVPRHRMVSAVFSVVQKSV